jgi:multiple sugar transport system permease protein
LQRKKLIFAILALLPAMGIYFWVRLIPIGETLRLSLHQWNILSKNKPFVGLDNFRELFGDPLFLESLFNTTIIAFGVLLITIPSSLFIAYLVFQRTRSRFAGFYETTLFLPHVVSLVPAAMAWKWIFDARLGPLNAALGWFGIEPRAWLFDPVL